MSLVLNFLNYMVAISISGVFILSIMSTLCFLNIEFFKLDEGKQVERGVQLIICAIVISKIYI
jgi:hypothetical protein